MGLFDKLIPEGINIADIEKRANEARETQEKILAELKQLNANLTIIKHVAEEWWKQQATNNKG